MRKITCGGSVCVSFADGECSKLEFQIFLLQSHTQRLVVLLLHSIYLFSAGLLLAQAKLLQLICM